MHIEHVYVSAFVQSSKSYKDAALSNGYAALLGDFLHHETEEFIAIRSPGVYLFGGIIPNINAMHGLAKEESRLVSIAF